MNSELQKLWSKEVGELTWSQGVKGLPRKGMWRVVREDKTRTASCNHRESWGGLYCCSGNRNGGLCVCVLWEGQSPPSAEGGKALGSPVKCRFIHICTGHPLVPATARALDVLLADVTVLVLTSSCVVVMCAAVCRPLGKDSLLSIPVCP